MRGRPHSGTLFDLDAIFVGQINSMACKIVSDGRLIDAWRIRVTMYAEVKRSSVSRCECSRCGGDQRRLSVHARQRETLHSDCLPME